MVQRLIEKMEEGQIRRVENGGRIARKVSPQVDLVRDPPRAILVHYEPRRNEEDK